MGDHTIRSSEQDSFDLPLCFGFGKTFHGFEGAEYQYDVETQYSRAVGPSGPHPESPLYGFSIPVYPTNSNSPDVRRSVYVWLKQTLTSPADMEDWVRACFGAEDIGWIRSLLGKIWQYSVRSWKNLRLNEHQIEDRLDESLLDTWMMALLATMLSLPVTIPPEALPAVKGNLRSLVSGTIYSDSSRPINKCVKSLIFDIYRRLVEKVMRALEVFRKRKIEDVSERHLCHVHCMSILIVVITSHLQTSLMDNYRLSGNGIPGLEEKTFEHIRQVETAFKNTVLHVRHRNKLWLRARSLRDGNIDLLQDIEDIKNKYSEGSLCLQTSQGKTRLS